MARDFLGAASQLLLPDAAVLRPSLPLTICARIKPDTLVAGGGILTTNKVDATHRGVWTSLNAATGELSVNYGDNLGAGPTNRRSKTSVEQVRAGVWQHVAFRVRGATDMTMWIDGRDAGGSYSGTGGSMVSIAGVQGRIGMQGGSLFDGLISDVALWSQGLSEEEILRLAAGWPAGFVRPGALCGWWPLYGYGAAGAAVDRTANRQDASLSGTVSPAPQANPGPDENPAPFALSLTQLNAPAFIGAAMAGRIGGN